MIYEKKGVFVSFEGGEGSGKSTHAEKFINSLREKGYNVVVIREPGGTEIGEQIRHILQYSKKNKRMFPETELLLFAASRAQLTREVIIPSLEARKVVLADRYADSTTVYQGVGRGIDMGAVKKINELATGCLRPDITFLLDIPVKVGIERARGKKLFDRMENQSFDFYKRVREGYLDLVRKEPERFKLISTEILSVKDVARMILSSFETYVDRGGLHDFLKRGGV